MKDLIEISVPILLLMLAWFAPVYVIYRVSRVARKNTSYVLVAGLLLGWIGAAVVALILPRMSDEEWQAFTAPRGQIGATMGNEKIVLVALGVMLAGLLGIWGLLAWAL